MKLQKVNQLGTRYYHRYKLGDEFFSQECTQQEYEALGLKDAGSPKSLPEGAVWMHSSGGAIKYDTPSGEVENGQYGEYGKYFVVKLDGKMPAPVTKDSIVDDELDLETESQIEALIWP